MMKKLVAALFALLIGAPAYGQSVQQSGTITRNSLPVWISNGVIGQGGTSADSPISSIGATGQICSNSARISSGAWASLCLQANTSSPSIISLQSNGAAPTEPLNFIVNGTTYPFPGSLANITIGTTPVVGGTNSLCLFVSGGFVGQQTCTLSAITSLIGDGTATGPGASTLTLATVNSNVGTFGSGAVVPIITVNGKGLITAVSTAPVGLTVGSSSITGGATNSILYQNGTVLGELSVVGNAVLSTNVSGVPSLSTTLPSGLTVPSPTFTGTETFPDSATWSNLGISKVAALSVGSATLPSGGNVSVSGQYQVNGTQIAASNLSNGTTGTGSIVLNTSPALSGTITGNFTASGNLTLSGNDTFSGQLITTGTTLPSQAAGQTIVGGGASLGSLSTSGQAYYINSSSQGAVVQGIGSINDFYLLNKSAGLVYSVPTGTTKLNFPSLSVGTCSSGLALDSGNNTILTSCPGSSASIQVGATSVTSGTSTQILYNNAGVLGNTALTAGTGISLSGTANATITNAGVVTVKKQVFTSSGTYTPSTGMLFAMLECVGSGGGGGGVNGGTSITTSAGGGGSGGYSRALVTSATVGASQTVTVGAAGTAGTAGNNAGGNASAVSVGSLCIANGGSGGSGNGNSGTTSAAGGVGGTAGTGDFTAAGNTGGSAIAAGNTLPIVSGFGGGSYLGGGAVSAIAGGTGCNAGVAASNYGSGGSGAACNNSATATAGGAGSKGIVYITEYNSQ
jgi:hypothetical protein